MRKLGLATVLTGMILLTANSASAGLVVNGSFVGFSASHLDSFVIYGESGHLYDVNNPGSGPGVGDEDLDAVMIAPTYSDGQTPMTGGAGATGRWLDAGVGDTVDVLLGADFRPGDTGTGSTDLSSLAGKTIRMVAYNDNGNDLWEHGLWIETVADGLVRSDAIAINALGGSATLTLDLTGLDLSEVKGYGVYVGTTFEIDPVTGESSAGDAFHSSWAIPEPASMICWTVMAGGFGFVVNRRKQKKVQE